MYLSANRFSTVKENETQILFSFFVFLCSKKTNRTFIFAFHFSSPGRTRNSNSFNALRYSCKSVGIKVHGFIGSTTGNKRSKCV